jgi:hypothetical protein
MRGVLVVLLGVAAVGGVASPVASATPSSCTAPHSRTVFQTHRIRVYSLPAEQRGFRVRWSCNRLTGRRNPLDDPDSIFSFPPPAMAAAGNLLAYSVTFEDEANGFTQIHVIDTTRDPDVHPIRRPALSESAAFGGDANRIGGVVLRPNGAVAWIACQMKPQAVIDGKIGPDCLHPGADDVVAAVPSNKKTRIVLDQGTDIDPTSLRRDGYRVSWVRGGKRKTIRLK